MSGQQWLVTSCCSSGCGGAGDHCSGQVTRGEPADGVTPPLSLWSLLGCTRHSATPTTTLIFHGSFTLHWHFSQISNIKNPHFLAECCYEGLNEATSRSPAIPCHCVMSDSRVSGQVATVSVKSLQSVGCCQGPGRGWAGLHSGLSSDQLGLWTSASVGQFWHRWKCWVTNDDSYSRPSMINFEGKTLFEYCVNHVHRCNYCQALMWTQTGPISTTGNSPRSDNTLTRFALWLWAVAGASVAVSTLDLHFVSCINNEYEI